jgi:hypothetical protein
MVEVIMLKKIIFIFILTVFFSGCDKSLTKQGGGKFGMLNSGNPEYAAIEFFEHIYRDKGLEGAIKFSSPKMERLIRSYHTNKGVQNHLLNMRFDKVSITSKTRSAGRNEFAKKAQISLFFEGELNGNILKDIRIVKLVKADKNWTVDEVSLN